MAGIEEIPMTAAQRRFVIRRLSNSALMRIHRRLMREVHRGKKCPR